MFYRPVGRLLHRLERKISTLFGRAECGVDLSRSSSSEEAAGEPSASSLVHMYRG